MGEPLNVEEDVAGGTTRTQFDDGPVDKVLHCGCPGVPVAGGGEGSLCTQTRQDTLLLTGNALLPSERT